MPLPGDTFCTGLKCLLTSPDLQPHCVFNHALSNYSNSNVQLNVTLDHKTTQKKLSKLKSLMQPASSELFLLFFFFWKLKSLLQK